MLEFPTRHEVPDAQKNAIIKGIVSGSDGIMMRSPFSSKKAMRNIGFLGGHSVYTVGSTSDVMAFFRCLSQIGPIADGPRATQDALFRDRMYRRYLTLEQLDEAEQWMKHIHAALACTPSAAIDWSAIRDDVGNGLSINVAAENLALVFERLINRFFDAVSSARSFHSEFGIYQPVRLVIADMPEFMLDKKRPAREYDALAGEPFWSR